MSRNLTAVQSLGSKYAVGEIVDFAGVPSFYDAGDSKWMQGNIWIAGNLLPSSLKANLASAGYSYVSADPDPAFPSPGLSASLVATPAKIGNTTVIGMRYSYGLVLVINSSGVQTVNTGLNAGNSYAPITVVSNGSAFFAFQANSSGYFNSDSCVRYSTDGGLTWSKPPGTFSLSGTLALGYSGSYDFGYSVGFSANGVPYHGSFASGTQYYQGGIFWTGSRFLAIGTDNNYWRVYRSTDGLSWSDDTVTILGSATLSHHMYHFYRNGNNCYLDVGGPTRRFSSNGGVTWSDVTGGSLTKYLQANTTDPAKLALSGTTALYVSTNNGQTWSNRSSAVSTLLSISAGVAYKGTTMIVGQSSGGFAKSTDDGATWSLVSLPVGVDGRVLSVCADENNFYVWLNSGTVLISSDAVTWTARVLPASVGSFTPSKVVTFGTGKIAAFYLSTIVWSLDGGVTWAAATVSSKSNAYGDNIRLVTNGVTTYLITSNMNTSSSASSVIIPESALSSGGAYFRATTSNLNPIRTGATAMIRVA